LAVRVMKIISQKTEGQGGSEDASITSLTKLAESDVPHSIIPPGGFMPGWGTGSFENEDAQSFLGRLDSLGVDDLRQILAHAADQDYLNATESGAAVAAAEVVAALVAAAKDETASLATPRQIVDWIRKIKTQPPPSLVDLARGAVERVRTNSELKDLWLEAEGLNEWSKALRDLEKRLGT
jgi:hypothetical protein